MVKTTKTNRLKYVGGLLIGIMLFTLSMSVLFDFELVDEVKAQPQDFITVKDGMFSYLDERGYNFQFQCEINQVLIIESAKIISEKQVKIISNNSFGETVLTFDLLDEGEVKFSIDHQGNMIRDYWFRLTIPKSDYQLLYNDSVLAWGSGNFNFIDMKDSSFWLDQTGDNYWLSVKFEDTRDFWIDPILSKEIVLDSVNIEVNNTIGQAEEDYDGTFDESDAKALLNMDENTGLVVENDAPVGEDFYFKEGSEPTWNDTSAFPTFNSSIRFQIGGFPYYGDIINSTGQNVPFSTNTFTIEMWIYIVGGTNQVLFSRGFKGGADKTHFQLQLSGGSYPNIVGDGGSHTSVDGFSLNVWNYLAYTYQSGSPFPDGHKIYLNGVEASSYNTGISSNVNVIQTDELYIGASYYYVPDRGKYAFNGYMDNFKYFGGRVMDENEIAGRYYNYTTYSLYGYGEADPFNVSADRIGSLINGSNQVTYDINYSINIPENETEDYKWAKHDQIFYVPHNYSFVNVTFGNGTIKTVEEGFEIDIFNSTHDQVNVTLVYDGTNRLNVNGTWNWTFITPNAVVYFEIDPNIYDGVLVNTSGIAYYIRIANDTEGIVNYLVNISIKNSAEEILTTQSKLTGANGWLNSTINASWLMTDDKKFHVCVFVPNATFMGYATKYITSYQDFEPPILNSVVYESKVLQNYPLVIEVYVEDEFTVTSDISVSINYGFISSGQLDSSATVVFYSGNRFRVEISGKPAETTIWFNFELTDNLTNTYTSTIFSADWYEQVAGGDEGGSDGDGGVSPATPAATSSGGDSTMMILFFIAGAVMVAVIGYGVFRRVTVRTRKVKTTEVVTGFGGFGKIDETITEKGG